MGWVRMRKHEWQRAGNVGMMMGAGIGWNSGYRWEVTGGKAGEADRGHLSDGSLHLFLLLRTGS